MPVKLTTIKRHKYITWHLPGDNYEAKEVDAKILIARGLSRIADAPVVKLIAAQPAIVPHGTKDQKAEKVPSRDKPTRQYKRRDMKAEE